MKGISNLSPKKQKAIIALLEKPTIRGVAESLNIGEVTIHRWLRDDEFQKVYKQAKKQVVGQAVSRLQNASSKAVDALMEIICDRDKPPSTRVAAARTVLEMSVKTVQLEDLEARLRDVEKFLRERK